MLWFDSIETREHQRIGKKNRIVEEGLREHQSQPNQGASTTDAARIIQLVDQLGSDKFAERERASKELAKIGMPALEAVFTINSIESFRRPMLKFYTRSGSGGAGGTGGNGGTGQQGGGVVDAFLRDGAFAVRVASRNPESEAARALAARGVDVVKADLLDPASLRMARTWGRPRSGATSWNRRAGSAASHAPPRCLPGDWQGSLRSSGNLSGDR